MKPLPKNYEKIIQTIQSITNKYFGSDHRVSNLRTPTMLGGANDTIIYDIEKNDKVQTLVLRKSNYFEKKSPFITMYQQFQTLKTTFNMGIATPEPLIMLGSDDELGEGFIMRFIDGESVPRKILSSKKYAIARSKLTAQCGKTLARIHQNTPKAVSYLTNITDSEDTLQAQIDRYFHYGGGHPALDLAIRWLLKNRPTTKEKCLVHGDFRLGNIIVDETGLKSILDWDCSHIGDPMEDIAWLCLRSWRYGNYNSDVGGFGERKALYESYVKHGGKEISERRIKWWEIFGFFRWAVLNMMQAHGHLNSKRKSLPFAICGRNICLIEYDLLMALKDKEF